jgi:ABC-type Fe3+ transport system permease subunit
MMGLIVGVATGLGYWLVLGLFQSIAQEQIEDHDLHSLNLDVHRSTLNSIIIGLLSGAIIGGIGFLGYWLSYGLNEGLSKGLSYGLDEGLSKGLSSALSIVWLFAICGGLFGWAVSGGWAVLRHIVLRWLLHSRLVFPWHAQALLNDATARILLRRVGGGYSFIHRLLLEYFANLDDVNITGRGQHIET